VTVRGLAVVVVLLLAGCKLANVLPGGSASQRAIESGVVRILNLRGDFDRYVNLYRQLARYEADGATALVPFARIFAQQTLDYQTSGAADFDKLYEELLR
jgi:hypothetical protein